jgi:hypothetical protein
MKPDAHVPEAAMVSPPDHETGLPGLRSWRAVYAVVFIVFLLWVGLLTWLTRYYTP